MNEVKLFPIAQGKPWPSGEGVDIAVIPITSEELASRIGMPLLHGWEDGLGNWAAIGGRLLSGGNVEYICYAHIPDSVILRADKNDCSFQTLDEALQLVGFLRSQVQVSPIVKQ